MVATLVILVLAGTVATGCGSDERATVAAVSGIDTAREPSTNAFGSPSRWSTIPPASVAAISCGEGIRP